MLFIVKEKEVYSPILSTTDNPYVILLNMKVVHTHFDSNTRQLFEEPELGNFVYFKDEEKLYKISLEKYNQLLIKLIAFINLEQYGKEEQTNNRNPHCNRGR